MKFTSARREGNSVIYTADDGSQIRYSGGDPAWRTNNPGNLWSASVSKRNDEIGKFGNFAVFPDYETGHGALLDSLRTTHGTKNLKDMISVYAPKSDSNDTARYLRFLRKKTGVKDDRKIKNFSPEQFEKLWRAIEAFEGERDNLLKYERTRRERSSPTLSKGWDGFQSRVGLTLLQRVRSMLSLQHLGQATCT
jgi:hypothetical protein